MSAVMGDENKRSEAGRERHECGRDLPQNAAPAKSPSALGARSSASLTADTHAVHFGNSGQRQLQGSTPSTAISRDLGAEQMNHSPKAGSGRKLSVHPVAATGQFQTLGVYEALIGPGRGSRRL